VNLKHDPFPLIFSQGDAALQLVCLDLFGLGDSPRAQACLLELIRQQRSDGTFPSQLDPNHWGMRETVRTALLLLKLGLPLDGVNVQSAVHFVLQQQRPDGGWSENPALQFPRVQTWLSGERSITWLTADVVELLRQVGMGGIPECHAPLAWLRSIQNRHGGWPSYASAPGIQQDDTGDPDATAVITFLLGEIYGGHDPHHTRGRDLFERHLDACARDAARGYWVRRRDGQKQDLDAYTLIYLLLSWPLDPPRRFEWGYNAGDPRVERMMAALLDIQGEDGGWRSFFSAGSSPLYTVLAVKTLVLSGVLTRADLQAQVRAYAL
jgi:hypothetical protein